jgi:uncharacterized damage-inducible protein DinB
VAARRSSPALSPADIPRAEDSAFQVVLDVYASEINKTASVWSAFADTDLQYRPHAKSTTVAGMFKHELLSGRRFFGEFLGLPEPDAAAVVPEPQTVDACGARLAEMAKARLPHLARATRVWWDAPVSFFDVKRSRLWVFWRRVLHSAHHRAQLTVYLRMLDRPVPSVYGPTADETWTGADPTISTEAARRG